MPGVPLCCRFHTRLARLLPSLGPSKSTLNQIWFHDSEHLGHTPQASIWRRSLQALSQARRPLMQLLRSSPLSSSWPTAIRMQQQQPPYSSSSRASLSRCTGGHSHFLLCCRCVKERRTLNPHVCCPLDYFRSASQTRQIKMPCHSARKPSLTQRAFTCETSSCPQIS